METSKNAVSEVFSVDDLLGKLTEQRAQTMDEAQKRTLLVDLAEMAELQAAARGDTGSSLVREVRLYLNSEEASTMFAFETLIQQLGDTCLDHLHDDETGQTATVTGATIQSRDAHETHEHPTHGSGTASRKTKTKNKKKSLTLFEYFITRQRLQANKKRMPTFLYP